MEYQKKIKIWAGILIAVTLVAGGVLIMRGGKDAELMKGSLPQANQQQSQVTRLETALATANQQLAQARAAKTAADTALTRAQQTARDAQENVTGYESFIHTIENEVLDNDPDLQRNHDARLEQARENLELARQRLAEARTAVTTAQTAATQAQAAVTAAETQVRDIETQLAAAREQNAAAPRENRNLIAGVGGNVGLNAGQPGAGAFVAGNQNAVNVAVGGVAAGGGIADQIARTGDQLADAPAAPSPPVVVIPDETPNPNLIITEASPKPAANNNVGTNATVEVMKINFQNTHQTSDIKITNIKFGKTESSRINPVQIKLSFFDANSQVPPDINYTNRYWEFIPNAGWTIPKNTTKTLLVKATTINADNGKTFAFTMRKSNINAAFTNVGLNSFPVIDAPTIFTSNIFTVAAAPAQPAALPNLDLVTNPDTLRFSPNPLVADQAASFSIKVKNGPETNVAATKTGFQIKRTEENFDSSFAKISTPALAANGSTTVTWQTTINQAGTYKLKICADVDNQIIESSEANCSAWPSITVNQAARSPDPANPPALTVSLSDPQPNVAQIPLGAFFQAAKINFSTTGQATITNLVISAKDNGVPDALPLAKIEKIRLASATDNVNENQLGPAEIQMTEERAVITNLNWTIEPAQPSKLIIYVQLKSDADRGKNFRIGIKAAADIHVREANATVNFAGNTEIMGPQISTPAPDAPNCTAGRVAIAGACACPPNQTEFAGGAESTFYSPSVCIPCTVAQLIAAGGYYCPQHKPPERVAATPTPPTPPTPPAPGRTCEQQGKYTYTGRDKPGVLYGMCIDCPMDKYVQYGGKCQPDQKTATAKKKTTSATAGGQKNKALEQLAAAEAAAAAEFEAQQAQAAAAQQQAALAAAAEAQARAAAATRGAATLNGSQRLVRAPERGNAGPGVAVYFGILGAIQGALWVRRKVRK